MQALVACAHFFSPARIARMRACVPGEHLEAMKLAIDYLRGEAAAQPQHAADGAPRRRGLSSSGGGRICRGTGPRSDRGCRLDGRCEWGQAAARRGGRSDGQRAAGQARRKGTPGVVVGAWRRGEGGGGTGGVFRDRWSWARRHAREKVMGDGMEWAGGCGGAGRGCLDVLCSGRTGANRA
jgi:hypothetical protein